MLTRASRLHRFPYLVAKTLVLIFVCGPSGFVEAASALLLAAGHPPFTIKTERFGAGG